MDRPDFVWKGTDRMGISDERAVLAIAKAANVPSNWPNAYSVMAIWEGELVSITILRYERAYYLVSNATLE